MTKLKENKCTFLCNVYICIAKLSMEYEIQISSFPSLGKYDFF